MVSLTEMGEIAMRYDTAMAWAMVCEVTRILTGHGWCVHLSFRPGARKRFWVTLEDGPTDEEIRECLRNYGSPMDLVR